MGVYKGLRTELSSVCLYRVYQELDTSPYSNIMNSCCYDAAYRSVIIEGA